MSWVRTAAILFAYFVGANAFFFWSTQAWLDLFGPAPGLVNPIVDRWIIMPLAILAWLPQLPSYGLFDYLEKLRSFGLVDSLLTVSTMSTVLYTPVVRWLLERRKARRKALDSQPRSEFNGKSKHAAA